jgi:hypothetical protein
MAKAVPPVDLTPDLWIVKLLMGGIDSSYDEQGEHSRFRFKRGRAIRRRADFLFLCPCRNDEQTREPLPLQVLEVDHPSRAILSKVTLNKAATARLLAALTKRLGLVF